jgi:hypothetical protein
MEKKLEKAGEPQYTFPQVNRVEVIDHTKSVEEGGGRCYTYWSEYPAEDGETPDIKNPLVEIRLQDNGRTLKVFISPPPTL